MKKLLLASIAALFVTQAQAVTLTIGYELPSVSPGTITEVAQSVDPVTGTLTASLGTFGWTVSTSMWAASTFDLRGTVNAVLDPYNIVSSISVYMTMSDITSPIGPTTFTNTMTVPTLPDGWTLNRTVYINDSSSFNGGNEVFSKMQYLNSPELYFSPGMVILNSLWNVAPGPYSITQFYGFQAVPPPLSSVPPVPPVPLPATLPLFATGLGVLGLLGWRRKRKGGVERRVMSQANTNSRRTRLA
jgi:PEP-CTERM motif